MARKTGSVPARSRLISPATRFTCFNISDSGIDTANFFILYLKCFHIFLLILCKYSAKTKRIRKKTKFYLS